MKKDLYKIIMGGIVFAVALIINPDNYLLKLAIFIVSYMIVGSDVVMSALKNILRGQVFDENFLMAIASIGAFFIGEYPEGVAVMLFYQVGELFQSYAVNKSRKSIASLMDIRPDYANVKIGEELVKTDPDEVKIGDIIVIKAGEKNTS
jgi:Zn2+/Cd2+-exporting ATPase